MGYHASKDDKDDGARKWEQHHSWRESGNTPHASHFRESQFLKHWSILLCLDDQVRIYIFDEYLQLIIAVR